jgi:dipeptidyl aminopeptidase/acylaminoacyl peptidase
MLQYTHTARPGRARPDPEFPAPAPPQRRRDTTLATPYEFERFLNIRQAYGPAFSPDDRRIYFITDITGLPQLWAVDAPGAWPSQVTYWPERVLYAIPDHAHGQMILGGDVGGNEHVQLTLLSADGLTSRALDFDPAIIHTFGGWSPDDGGIAYAANSRNPAFFDVYTLAVTTPGATPTRVYQHDGTNYPVAWAPDSSALIVTNVEKPANNNLYLVPLDGSAPTLLTAHSGDAVYQSVEWAPDGGSLYLVTDEGREFTALVRLNLGSGAWEKLAAPDWDVESCHLSPDGRYLAYTVNAGGYSELHVRDLQTGEDHQPTGLPNSVIGVTGSSASGYASEIVWSHDSTRLAFNFHSPTRNLDIWVWNLADGTAQPVTRSDRAGIPLDAFAEPELIHYASFDGRSIPAFLYVPPDLAADQRIPCIINVHGGPESQTRATFNPIIQYFVQRGYAVLAPNVRGSSGYGRTYVHLDDVRLRMDSVKDLAAAVAWLQESGQIDARRIAVMGGSYGGFMTLAAVTSQPTLWAAGVDIVGIANFETFLQNTGPWRRKLREAEYGSLEADADFLREISPIHYVDRITAPLMVIHGANDPRVPVGEAEQIVASLKNRQHPVEYLRFEDEGHGVVKLKNRLVAYPAIGDFLDKYLRDA